MKANTTDPESRIMKTRTGFVQGYNGQSMVETESQVIVAADLVQDENDRHQQSPLIEKVKRYLGRLPERVIMDAGYWDEQELKS